MGVSIGWRKKNPKKLDYINGGSTFHDVLETAFGGFPMTLDDNHISVLHGVAACGFDGATELIVAISKHGAIEVDAEW